MDMFSKESLSEPFCGYLQVIDEMSRDDFMEGLLKEFPLLKKDRMALAVARDFILSCALVMGKQNMEDAFLHSHPVFSYLSNNFKALKAYVYN